jgi:hypothetical protein
MADTAEVIRSILDRERIDYRSPEGYAEAVAYLVGRGAGRLAAIAVVTQLRKA